MYLIEFFLLGLTGCLLESLPDIGGILFRRRAGAVSAAANGHCRPEDDREMSSGRFVFPFGIGLAGNSAVASFFICREDGSFCGRC